MARLTQAPITPSRNVSNSDSLEDLDRLLARLQSNILHADAEREKRLRTSEYERSRVNVNLEYAQTLLAKLERDAAGVKAHARRQELQADLGRKREALEQVAERLREIEDISVYSDEDSSEGEDVLGGIDTPSESVKSVPSGAAAAADWGEAEGDDDEGDDEEEAGEEVYESAALPELRQPDPPNLPALSTATSTTQQPQPTTSTSATSAPAPAATETATTTTQTLRARGPASQPQHATALPDTAETTALRARLFGDRNTADASAATTTATAEAILDRHRAEQEDLTSSMVAMARSLKASTHRFSSALLEDADALAAAGRGLDAGGRGLDTVAGRVGVLRRATEGKGWWGRVLLYVWIAGLALFAVLLVFVFPKLRF
ncbi:hypothetical protein GGS23DRAFT_596928 [Durotheca rogersii]|uniref:uncharacterized protein n=1 Tax=Durotheca rogersii TaxID=419775 RepID=UPI0022203490|nr:uncharacterized protein GGS23DRAFT_596928 [Durotheca rogersii]KAI5863158.1 hypothetical protein GGS23DRAFT_596928 [Durotheca rogersii]